MYTQMVIFHKKYIENGENFYANPFSEMLGSIYWQNGDTLGLVELIVWLEQGNQGDQREQDDQGEVSIIIFGMSESSGFQKYSKCRVFETLCLCFCLCHFLCHCICVLL